LLGIGGGNFSEPDSAVSCSTNASTQWGLQQGQRLLELRREHLLKHPLR
jgi:hypothetical protein